MKPDLHKIKIKWMDAERYKVDILALRHRIYTQEQGVSVADTPSEKAIHSLHLGAFYQGQLVSMISAFVVPEHGTLRQLYKADRPWGCSVRYGMRMELPEFRGTQLNSLLCAHLCLSVYQNLRPERSFVLLLPEHQHLAGFYQRYWGKTRYAQTDEGEILICDGPDAMLNQYLIARRTLHKLIQRQFPQLLLPGLVPHLRLHQQHALIACDKLQQENLYVSGVELESELPRLSQQAHALYAMQSPTYQSLNSLPEQGNMLDIGSGAGVYLNLLSQHPRFQHWNVSGLEGALALHSSARQAYPFIQWHHASAYQTGLASQSQDLVHAGFLFIHLTSPELALEEMTRLLKTGGHLYIVDVNDATFNGPPALKQVVKQHYERYQGDRCIMQYLPQLAANYGLALHTRLSTHVGDTHAATADVRLPTAQLLNMFDFIGQMPELSQTYAQAKQSALSGDTPIGIKIQTLVFEKIPPRAEAQKCA